jgi:hypothetical protein
MDTLRAFFAEHPTLWSQIGAIPWRHLYDLANAFLADPAQRGTVLVGAAVIYASILWILADIKKERRRVASFDREYKAANKGAAWTQKIDALERLAGLHLSNWAQENYDTTAGARRQIRDKYFSVANVEYRKALIVARNEHHAAWQNHASIDAENARLELIEAKAFPHGAYNASSFYALIWVYLGWTWFAVPGAIAAAVIAYFAFHQRLAIAKINRRATIAQAKLRYDQANAREQKARSAPPVFADDEAKTGERAEYYDEWYSRAA